MKSRKPKQPETVDGSTQKVLPPTRRIDLATLEQCRSEMARAYRDVDAGKIDSSEGSRRVYMLLNIGKMIELADLEKRLERLEEIQTQRIGVKNEGFRDTDS
jgi:hypothetical protein